jgi:hypothetical protein
MIAMDQIRLQVSVLFERRHLTTPAVQDSGAGPKPAFRFVNLIWKPMNDSSAPILVSFQTRLFLRVGGLNVRDWKVNSMGAIESSESPFSPSWRAGFLLFRRFGIAAMGFLPLW